MAGLVWRLWINACLRLLTTCRGPADLVERYGQDVQPTSAETRADIAAARARVMHTLYVAAHGTAVALREYANDLRDRLHLDTQRRRPVELRPDCSRDRGG